MSTIKTRICLRKDTKNNWTSVTGGNIILLNGEMAIVVDTSVTPNTVNFKIGDGTTTFSNLPYITLSELKAKQISIDNTTDLKIGNSDTLQSILDTKADLVDGKVPSTQLPSLTGQTYDLHNISDCIRLCGAVGRLLGATIIYPVDIENGTSIAQQYNIQPTDSTTFGDLETEASLSDTDTIEDLFYSEN